MLRRTLQQQGPGLLLRGEQSRPGSASGTLTLACCLEKVCPGVGPSGIMDRCVEMLKINPLNFNVPPRVSAIAPWPALYIPLFKDGMPDFPKVISVEKEQGD